MGWIAGQDEQRDERRDAAIQGHVNHWEPHGGTPNLDCFGPGFDAGWAKANAMRQNGEPDPEDAQEFAKGQRREEEYGVPHDEEPDNHWEWEHGFWQGMFAAWDHGHWEGHKEEGHAQEGGEEGGDE